jgi:ComF family protein
MPLQSNNLKYDKEKLARFGNKCVDFILPPLCPVTGEMVDQLGMVDPKFWQQLTFINSPFCDACGTPFAFDAGEAQCGACLDHPPTFCKNRSALAYNDASREMILKFKHGDQLHAVKAFTPWLIAVGHHLIEEADIICPVPLHLKRLVKRRYNQADIIARDIIKHYPHKSYAPNLLVRTRNTESQGHKKATDRQKNIRNAFDLNPKAVKGIEGKNILIIDDVYTTGATLNECSKTLLNNGAQSVNTLTLAKVVKD